MAARQKVLVPKSHGRRNAPNESAMACAPRATAPARRTRAQDIQPRRCGSFACHRREANAALSAMPLISAATPSENWRAGSTLDRDSAGTRLSPSRTSRAAVTESPWGAKLLRSQVT
jgi:hypothetical protein